MNDDRQLTPSKPKSKLTATAYAVAISQRGISAMTLLPWLLLVAIGGAYVFGLIGAKSADESAVITAPTEPKDSEQGAWQAVIADPATRSNPDAAAPVSSYHAAVSQAAQSVVNIYTTQAIEKQVYSNDPVLQELLERYHGGRPQGEGSSLGSGVVVSADGYILTNAHVIAQADEITVAFNDGRKARATVVGSDRDSDLAVIKVQMDKLVPMAFRADDIQVGDVALAIGNPFGVGQTVTQGIISATGRRGIGVSSFEDFIQTDAAINPGNSGGALVDANGALIGINTAIYSRSGGSMGIGFAIPTTIVQRVMNELISTGKVSRGWMGIEMMARGDDPSALESSVGIVVAQVWQGGPAHKAGLRRGDVILAIDGVATNDANTLIGIVAQKSPGTSVTVKLERNGKSLELPVVLAERPSVEARDENRSSRRNSRPSQQGELDMRELMRQYYQQFHQGR